MKEKRDHAKKEKDSNARNSVSKAQMWDAITQYPIAFQKKRKKKVYLCFR